MDTDVQSFAVANLRRRPEVVEAGGFVAGFDPTTDSPYINYATPLPGARPGPRDVAALVTAFQERGLTPRLEFAPDAAPEAEPALRRAGFGTEAVHTYLVCTPHTLTVPPAGGPAVRTPRTDEEYAAVDAAQSEAFGGVFPPSPEGAARLRRMQEGGGAVRFVPESEDAEDAENAGGDGCAGAACCSAPAVGTAELSGVATRPACRGRGVAAAVTAAVTGAMFARGARTVWLEFSGEGSRRVYERVGFRPRGTRLYLVLGG
ncbi:GNAT family N-acetyltransferase [Streptomyces griseosporeus]|uniref:GNAT family N-acetyltransferase n=1 Tax=Streptomyces griseosporeus TaxID=1910 RepID=UPI0037010C8F